MKINLDQDTLKKAVAGHMLSLGINHPVSEVIFTAKRGAEGMTAVVTINTSAAPIAAEVPEVAEKESAPLARFPETTKATPKEVAEVPAEKAADNSADSAATGNAKDAPVTTGVNTPSLFGNAKTS